MSYTNMPGIHLETCGHFKVGDIVCYGNLGNPPGGARTVWVSMDSIAQGPSRRITITRETKAIVTKVENGDNVPTIVYTIRHLNLLAEDGKSSYDRECSFEANSPHHSWLTWVEHEDSDTNRWDLLLV